MPLNRHLTRMVDIFQSDEWQQMCELHGTAEFTRVEYEANLAKAVGQGVELGIRYAEEQIKEKMSKFLSLD